jgi:hypothetical protein
VLKRLLRLVENKKTVGFVMLLGAFTGITSCEVINPDEPIPCVLAIDSVQFTAGTSQGSSSASIIDSWVYVDNDLQGTYEMPFSIPMQYSGKHTISIRPGIKVNGLTAIRSVNPLYTNYDTVVNLEPEKTTKLYPKSTYINSAIVNIVDDFNTGTVQFQRDPDSDTALVAVANDAFEGPFSGAFYFSGTRTRFSATSLNKYVLTKGKYNVIEINYKCDNAFVVGLVRNYLGQTSRIQILAVLPSDGKWKKIYVSIIDAVNNLNADNYNLWIYAQRDQGINDATIMLDNIKLVHN